MRLATIAALGTVLALSPTTAAGQIQFGPVQTYTGMCEPSGAIAVPDGNIDDLIIIANDEDNILRAYNPQRADPLPLAGADLNKYLGTNPNDNDQSADFEGATWMNKKAYWIGSHSRSKKGNRRDSRSSFFATTVSGGSDKPVVTTGEKSFAGLLAAIAALSPRLEETIKLKTKQDAALAPDNGGFNIEGLTVRPDGKSMLIALRTPLINGSAVLIPFENPEAVVEKHAQPMLRAPIPLDLGGRGVRSIEYSAAAKAYFIIAGPAGGASGTFDLYLWPHDEPPKAAAVPGFADALQKLKTSPRFDPEAMVIDSTGKRLRIFSDDGDTCNKAAPAFRSVLVTLP